MNSDVTESVHQTSSGELDAMIQTCQKRWIESTGEWYAALPEFPGVWAVGTSEDDCLAELRSVLMEWLACEDPQ